MVMIKVTKKNENLFVVDVEEYDIKTQHLVTLSDKDYERLCFKKVSKEILIQKSFEFLLMNESNEQILRSFDLSVISQYFPEYEERIKMLIE